ncbi:MAG: hypothetical protein FRX48_04295 [Lasallia pustulata]|uniref:Uncharacterized protein n=1 Tax=Lasallia pustulata TaxID=136370 RepID=A0A5M8PU50_9LECA|nr:MAG: hypothetical protein FRX48_04295 [Lasallia pustulata]
MAMLMAILGCLPVINGSPAMAGMGVAPRDDPPPTPCYAFSADPWFNPPSIAYLTTSTQTAIVDCQGCDLLVVNPPKYEAGFTFEGTVTMPTTWSYEYLCAHFSHTGKYPVARPSSEPDSTTTTVSSTTITTTLTQAVPPSPVRRGLELTSPTCTTTVVQYVARPTPDPYPILTVYAETATVDQMVDCNWCELHLETQFAGKSMVLPAPVSPLSTVYKALATSTQTLCGHGEPVQHFDLTNGDNSIAGREVDLLNLPQRRDTPPPCAVGDCFPDPPSSEAHDDPSPPLASAWWSPLSNPKSHAYGDAMTGETCHDN